MSVLSISSHVSFGYVGNDASGFCLRRLGIEVWQLDSVVFSNHTGYGEAAGRRVPAEELAALLNGIARRGALSEVRAVLSGYLGSAETIAVVADAVARVRRERPGALFCCDPVLGDEGRDLFVPQTVAKAIRDSLVPLADILTPNLFELCWLTDRQIATRAEAVAAARSLIAKGPGLVLVTSLRTAETAPGSIEMLAVTRDEAFRVASPFQPLEPLPNGAGDAVAGLFLAHCLKDRCPAEALTRTAAAIDAVIAETLRLGRRELALIQAQDALEGDSEAAVALPEALEPDPIKSKGLAR